MKSIKFTLLTAMMISVASLSLGGESDRAPAGAGSGAGGAPAVSADEILSHYKIIEEMRHLGRASSNEKDQVERSLVLEKDGEKVGVIETKQYAMWAAAPKVYITFRMLDKIPDEEFRQALRKKLGNISDPYTHDIEMKVRKLVQKIGHPSYNPFS